MIRTRLLPLVATLLLAAGCGGSPPLATVGSQTITVEDFVAAARENPGRYPDAPDSGRHVLLEDLVTRALLVEEAKRRGIDRDSLSQRAMQALEDQAVLAELLQRMAPRAVAVSEAEVDSFHHRNGVESHALVILTPDRPAADEARRLLDAGTPFGAVADRFNISGMVPPGGDIGFQRAGSMMEPLDDVLLEAPLGEVVGPIDASGEGWFLVQVLERRDAPLDSLDATQRPRIRELVRQRKQRSLAARAGRTLLAQYRVEVAHDAPQALFRRYNTVPDPVTGMIQPPPPTPEQAATVLATYDDARGARLAFTLGEAVSDLVSGAERPDFSRVSDLERWIQNRVLQRVAAIEGRRRHLHEEPAVQRRARERFNNQLAEQVYSGEVMGAVRAGEADIAAAYERHRGQLERLSEARLLWIAYPDSASAAAVLQHAGHSGTLAEAVAMASPGTTATEERLTFPSADPLWAALSGEITAMAPLQYRGPFPSPRGWMLFQLLDKRQEGVPFAELPPGARQALETEALELAREARLRALIAELRARIPVQVNEKRLGAIAWPVAAPANPVALRGGM
jgi:peptidyl-prolyl cis-trans isomerase C